MATPREPEIEAMARAARGFMWVLRLAFWIGGSQAVLFGLERSFTPDQPPFEGALPVGVPNALGAVWLCLGFPALLPIDWLFGRGRWCALAISVALWFGPMLLDGDHRQGFLLRIVATFVVVVSLLVWRTLWRLTSPTPPANSATEGV
jgi:hypothetical protein